MKIAFYNFRLNRELRVKGNSHQNITIGLIHLNVSNLRQTSANFFIYARWLRSAFWHQGLICDNENRNSPSTTYLISEALAFISNPQRLIWFLWKQFLKKYIRHDSWHLIFFFHGKRILALKVAISPTSRCLGSLWDFIGVICGFRCLSVHELPTDWLNKGILMNEGSYFCLWLGVARRETPIR